MHTLIVELTNRCNFNCIWCGTNLGREDLSKEDAKLAIDKFQPKRVFFTGGEPLLRPDLINLINHCKENNMKVTLLTNGSLITEEIAKKINADLIFVSLDGTKEVNDSMRGKGSYKKAIQGLEYLKNAKKKVGIATTVGQNNKKDIIYFVSSLKDKVDLFLLARVHSLGKARKEHCISNLDAFKLWLKLHKFMFRTKIAFSVQYWGLPQLSFAGPMLLADGKLGKCCVRYNEVVGNLKTPKIKSTFCLFCRGCSYHSRKSSPSIST